LLALCPESPAPRSHTRSLHDALPIFGLRARHADVAVLVGELAGEQVRQPVGAATDLEPVLLPVPGRERRRLRMVERVEVADAVEDRKSTRLNSSHVKISYAVFCLKKK